MPNYGSYSSPYVGVYGLGYGNYPLVMYVQHENSNNKTTELQTNDWSEWSEWHWCSNPEGYYPYVTKCLKDWIPVAPKPSVQ